MIILSIDTSTPRLAVCLSKDGDVLAGQMYPPASGHMNQLLPAIEAALAEAGLEPRKIDAYAASVGPGSFTGIRIGVATVQALAMANQKPCLALNTLEACAHEKLAPDRVVVPMLEARNRRIYTAAYFGDGQLLEPQVIAVDTFMEELVRVLPKGVTSLVFAGDETAEQYAADEKVRRDLPLVPEAGEMFYSVGVLARLAHRAYTAGKHVSASELLPEYYQATQAERNFGVYL